MITPSWRSAAAMIALNVEPGGKLLWIARSWRGCQSLLTRDFQVVVSMPPAKSLGS